MPWGQDTQAAAAPSGGWGKDPVVTKPKRRGIVDYVADEIGGTVAGAARQFGRDAKRVVQNAQETDPDFFRDPVGSVKNSTHEMLDTGRALGSGLALAVSPVAGAVNAFAVKPAAAAIDATGIPVYEHRGVVGEVQNAFAGGGPPRRLEGDERRAELERGVGTAMMAAGSRAPTPRPAPTPNALARNVEAFDQAGVRPSLAAVTGGRGAAAVTNAVAENPLAGIPARGRLRGAVDDTAASAQRIAGEFGETRGAQITGENVQAGVTRFARDRSVTPATPVAPAGASSFSAKAGALYDQAFGKIANAPVETNAASTLMTNIMGRVSAPALAELVKSPKIEQIARALTSDAGQVTFSDLRALRTWVREARKSPELTASIGEADLARLESALTEDIYAGAGALGGSDALQSLRRADQFYGAGQRRIKDALSSFTDAGSGESAYRRVVQAAGSTGAADAQKLLSLKRSLSADEWGDVSANVVSELGRPTAGAAPVGEEGFSIATFVTNYNKLSPRGKDILFGSVGGGGSKATQLRSELENLAKVANMLKDVERGANTSKSFVNAQAFATLGGMSMDMGVTASVLSGLTITGEMMTNPLVVRWLARLGSAKARGPGPFAATLKTLAKAANDNAALMPLAVQARALAGESAAISAPIAAEETPDSR